MNQEFYQYQQNKQLPLTSYHWTWIKNSTNINKTNNYLWGLTSYHWTWIKNSTNINKTNNYLSYHITEHESRILPISTKQTTTSEVSHHITEHESRILPISTKQTTTSHIISLNMNQEFYQYQQNKQLPLISYHWTWINNSTNINKTNNYLSYHITEHDSRILPISTKQTTTSHIISLNMIQEFYQYQQNKQLPLISYHWTWFKNSTNINKTNNYLWGLTSYHWTWIKNSTNINKTNNYLWGLTSYHWTWIKNSTNINKTNNYLWGLTSYHWTWIKNSTNINKTNNYLSYHITEHESRILPISTKQTTTSHIISLNMNQEFYQYQQNKQLPLISYHWTWIKNSTNINKTNNYLSYHITEHESRILPISTKQTTTSHIISLNMNQEFYQYQQNKQLPLISYHWTWIKNSTNINKTNN